VQTYDLARALTGVPNEQTLCRNPWRCRQRYVGDPGSSHRAWYCETWWFICFRCSRRSYVGKIRGSRVAIIENTTAMSRRQIGIPTARRCSRPDRFLSAARSHHLPHDHRHCCALQRGTTSRDGTDYVHKTSSGALCLFDYTNTAQWSAFPPQSLTCDKRCRVVYTGAAQPKDVATVPPPPN